MSAFTGTATLLRLRLRRDRVLVPLSVVVLAVLVWTTAVQSEELYSTQAERVEYAATVVGNAGIIALIGPPLAVETVGGDVAWQWGGLGAVTAALLSMFVIGRHTRAEEQSGRSELVGSGVVGRLAAPVAALCVAAAAQLALGALVAVSLVAEGLSVEGSASLGASFAAVGLVFAAIALLAAQVSRTTGGAYAIVGAVLGGSYVLRAAGDVGDGTLSWASPVGWAQQMRPFADERWWPFLLLIATTAALGAIALRFAARRDDGAALLADRPGPARGEGAVLRPAGLALRMSRGSLFGWTLGLFLSGVMVGSIAQDADSILGDSDVITDLYEQAGGSLVDNYLALSNLSMAQIGTAFAISCVLRLRRDEQEGRAEALLATALSRTRWMGAQVVVAVAGSVLVVGSVGLGAGLADAIVAGDAGRLPRLLVASLAHLPAVWVLTGLTAALVGIAPRAAAAAWAALGAVFLLAFLGPLLSLPDWVLGLSPFDHVPLLPAGDAEALPIAVLCAIAAALVAVGLAGFARRDVGAA